MLVSGVFNSADGAIGVMEAVHALNVLAVARLMLVLVVAGVGVLDFVLVLVFGVSLEDRSIN